jgi:6-pyruvoyltetrahydropterin/6-carboxytetrahydropterin synthase
MIIRKKYGYESCHVVRNCSSERCSKNLHGHSYTVEVMFEASKLDEGGMVLDFGLTKNLIGSFIDGFDHCIQAWNKDHQIVKVAKDTSERYIIMPINPSAENYALMFLFVADKILGATQLNNGESDDIKIHSVRVHETATGYAEAFRSDLSMVNFTLDDIEISDQVQEEYKYKDMWVKLKAYYQNTAANLKPFKNPVPEHYVM